MTRTKVYKNGQWSYADNVGTAQWGSIEGTLSNQTDLNTALGNKVDKETGKGLFSGSYNDLTNKPTIPTKTSDLTNDSGYITNSYHDSSKQDTLVSGTNIKTINNNSILGNGNLQIESDSTIYIPKAVFNLTTESTSQEILNAFTQDVIDKIKASINKDGTIFMVRYSKVEQEGETTITYEYDYPVNAMLGTAENSFEIELNYSSGHTFHNIQVGYSDGEYFVEIVEEEDIISEDDFISLSNKTLKKDNTIAWSPTGDYQPSTKKYVDDKAATKQDSLVSGTNIKTINSQSLLGSGDITISGGSENWELINTVTVTEDVQNILINQDTNGNGFELKKIFLNVTTKPSTDAPTTRYNMRVYTGLYSTRRQVTSTDNIVTKLQAFTGATENFMMQINLESLVRVGDIVYTGATLIGENITQGYNPRSASGNASRTLLDGYTFVELEAVNASSIFGVGSEIKLYGVRV